MKRVVFLTVLSFLLLSCRTAKNGPDQAKTGIRDSLDREITHLYQQGMFNGFAVSIVDDQSVLYQKGFGFSDVKEKKPYTDRTVQNIASVTKTFVGIAVLKAQELGQLNLDDPINKYLPFRVVNPHFPETEITIRQLTSHTSSILDNEFYLSKTYYLKPGQDLKGAQLNFDDEQVFNPSDSVISMETYLEKALTKGGEWSKDSFSSSSPGSTYEYSNTGTTLAAYIVERASGHAFSDFTQKYILHPLQMNDSGWTSEEVNFARFSRLYENPAAVLPYYYSISYPDGGLITNIHDLSLFMKELIKGYNGKGKLLTQASYKQYFTPQLTAASFTERNDKNPYSESYNTGIFIGFGYTGYIGHTGGDPGVMSMMFFNPENNLGRIMIFNTNFSDKKGNDVFYSIWNALEKYQNRLKKSKR